ncbi:MAG: TrkA family potassium uptake protein, partial [Oscillospiraceae bacterium]
KLANQLDLPVICGDGSSLGALQSAGAGDADALVSVTGADEDNLIVCQLAKRIFHLPRTVARVNNPKNTAVMKLLGVDIPVSSTDSLARVLEHEIDAAAIRQLMRLNRGESSLLELTLPQHYARHGITLSEILLPEESIVVTITRDGEMLIPRGSAQLLSGDKLLVVCRDTVVHELCRLLGVS